MKALEFAILLLFAVPAIADNAKDWRYWQSASLTEIEAANKKIAENVETATILVSKPTSDYSATQLHLDIAENLCYAMKCKANKGPCLEAFKMSGMVRYLQNKWVPALAEITNTPSDHVVREKVSR